MQGVTRKVPRVALIRAARLLDMLYKPRELSAELGVPDRTIREWAEQGMPHDRDGRGRIWINGVAFSRWLQTRQTERVRFMLAKDEAFCVRCRRRVKLLNPVVSYRTKPPLLTGSCPDCGHRVKRGVKRDLPS